MVLWYTFGYWEMQSFCSSLTIFRKDFIIMQFYLAPMEGLTGYVYRNAYHKYFPAADRYFTPFITNKK